MSALLDSPAPEAPPLRRPAWRDILRRPTLARRLLAVGLSPLLLALPLFILVLGWAGARIADAQLHATIESHLSSSQSYLRQLREGTLRQLVDYSNSERLRHLLKPQANLQALELQLRTAVRERGLSFLVVAHPDGRILASSNGAPAGVHLPDSYVIRQARTGLAASAFERLEPPQQAALLPRTDKPGTASLIINAAAHFPLSVDTPDAILVGGLLINDNHALAEHLREVIFPADADTQTRGQIAMFLNDQPVARSRDLNAPGHAAAFALPLEASRSVLAQGNLWFGTLHETHGSFMAGFSPLVNGEGQRIGILGVAFSDETFIRHKRLAFTGLLGLLRLTMLAISLRSLRIGRDLTLRIDQLNHTMTEVRQGRREARVTVSGPHDELQKLNTSFNELLDTIAKQDQSLLLKNQELEALGSRLRQEHERLNRVIAGTRAGTWAWNVQTGQTLFNERWAEIVGYTLEELSPTTIDTWMRLAHPDDLQRSQPALQAHLAGQAPYYDAEIRMRHKLGHWVWVHDRGQIGERDTQGQPVWMFGTHLDISKRHDTERQRAELLQRLQNLSSNVPGMLYQLRRHPDGQGQFLYASEGVRDIYGCTPQALLESRRRALEVVHPQDLPGVLAAIETSARELTSWHLLYRVNHPSRGLRWVEGTATPRKDDDGGITWHGYIRDVTEQQRSREQLKLAASVFDASQEGILITDAHHVIVETNQACERITGYSRSEILGKTPALFRSGHHDRAFYEELHRSLARDGHWKGEIWNRRKGGELYAQLLSIAAIRGDDGDVSHFIAILTDISPLKAEQSKLDRIANYDVLTGIPNRRLLTDRLEQAIAYARRRALPLAVCMMDLDGFKQVNDSHGHEAGDRLLVEVARRLSQVIRADETVARLGGDEFVLIFTNPQGVTVFERVLQAVREEVDIGSARVRVSASLGIVYLNAHNGNQETLLRTADLALYQAKQQGRDRYVIAPQT